MADTVETNDTSAQRPFTLLDAAPQIFSVDQVSVQEDEQILLPFRDRNVVGVVSGADARSAIITLERAGIGGERISFVRLRRPRAAPAAGLGTDTTPSSSLAEGAHPRGPVREMERSTLKGAVMGAVIGAVLVGVAVLVLGSAESALWAALGGLLLGGALGGLWATFAKVGASPAWERSLQAEPDAVALVAAHVDDDETSERVGSLLDDHEVWVLALDGTVLRSPAGRGPR